MSKIKVLKGIDYHDPDYKLLPELVVITENQEKLMNEIKELKRDIETIRLYTLRG